MDRTLEKAGDYFVSLSSLSDSPSIFFIHSLELYDRQKYIAPTWRLHHPRHHQAKLSIENRTSGNHGALTMTDLFFILSLTEVEQHGLSYVPRSRRT
jgi:hypothetical protein